MAVKPKPKQEVLQSPDPGWRVDILIQRIIDASLKRAVDNHPLTARLRQVGLDPSTLVRVAVKDQLKRDKITNVRSVIRALRRS